MKNDIFKVHILTDKGIAKAKILQTAFEEFLLELEDICGAEGREMSLVRTKLQEASFFAKRAMAIKNSHDE